MQYHCALGEYYGHDVELYIRVSPDGWAPDSVL
jgi:hypothetical protein